jgi:hypothetical protein
VINCNSFGKEPAGFSKDMNGNLSAMCSFINLLNLLFQTNSFWGINELIKILFNKVLVTMQCVYAYFFIR